MSTVLYHLGSQRTPKSIVGPLVSRYSSAMCVYVHARETVVNAQKGDISLHAQR
jgi:hypothetical protein